MEAGAGKGNAMLARQPRIESWIPFCHQPSANSRLQGRLHKSSGGLAPPGDQIVGRRHGFEFKVA
jgi:hypothetical protein